MTVKELMEILSKLPPHCLIVDQRFDSLGKDFERIYRESDLVDAREVGTVDGNHGVNLFFSKPRISSK